MAFKIHGISITHAEAKEILSVRLKDKEKHIEASFRINPSKHYLELTIGEALQLATDEANKLGSC